MKSRRANFEILYQRYYTLLLVLYNAYIFVFLLGSLYSLRFMYIVEICALL